MFLKATLGSFAWQLNCHLAGHPPHIQQRIPSFSLGAWGRQVRFESLGAKKVAAGFMKQARGLWFPR